MPVDKDVMKEAVKEAIKEWLDEQFIRVGKWTMHGIAAMGFAALVYVWLMIHGYIQAGGHK